MKLEKYPINHQLKKLYTLDQCLITSAQGNLRDRHKMSLMIYINILLFTLKGMLKITDIMAWDFLYQLILTVCPNIC